MTDNTLTKWLAVGVGLITLFTGWREWRDYQSGDIEEIARKIATEISSEIYEKAHEEFLSKYEGGYFYDKRKENVATATQFQKVNTLVTTHQADHSQHYPKSEVVTDERFEAQIAVTQGALNNLSNNMTELKVDIRDFKQEFRAFVREFYKGSYEGDG